MHLPRSLSRITESFPGGSLKVCSLFLGWERRVYLNVQCSGRQIHITFPEVTTFDLNIVDKLIGKPVNKPPGDVDHWPLPRGDIV